MKSRPILFSAPMVRSLLAGTKTQTRRAIKAPPSITAFRHLEGLRWDRMQGAQRGDTINCPYGQPGDQLWARETWAEGIHQMADVDHWAYAADRFGVQQRLGERWKPSIHMPRAASRITLEITGVRVERLQDISEADAKAEGCERLDEDEPGYVFREGPDWKVCPKCGGTRLHTALGGGGGVIFDVDCLECDTYVKRYRHLWESINGPGSWDANPWVWALDFRRISQ